MDALIRAQDWVYKGEGNANVVYTYTGTNPDLVRRSKRRAAGFLHAPKSAQA